MKRNVRIIECCECIYKAFSSSISNAYRCENKHSPVRHRTVMPNDYCAYGESEEDGSWVEYID